MKYKLGNFCWILIIMFMWGFFSSFTSYDSAWNEVDKLTKEKPKTALDRVKQIEQRAQNEKNDPQELRAIFEKFKINCQLEEGDYAFNECLENLSKFKSSHKNKVALAVASYLESMAYAAFFGENSWNINRRTQLLDSIPADIKEWTANHFVDKIRTLRDEALNEPAIRQTLSTDYETLVSLKEDSRLYRPTLYDLMVNHAIDQTTVEDNEVYSTEEVEQLRKALALFHEKDTDSHAYVKILLDILLHDSSKDEQQKITELEQMLQQYVNEPASVLIRIELANRKYSQLKMSHEGLKPSDVLEICEAGIRQFPSHAQIYCLKNIIQDINRKEFSVSLDASTIHANESLKLTIRYANMDKIKLSLYRYDVTPQEWFVASNRAKLGKTKVADYSFDLEKTDYCIQKERKIELPAQPYGIYLLTSDKEKLDFVVSDLLVIDCRSVVNGKTEMVVVDSKAGFPMKGVNAHLYKSKYKALDELLLTTSSDKDGFMEISKVHGYNCWLERGKDVYSPIFSSGYLQKNDPYEDNTGDYLSIFTDRSVYRPGQTVYFKCIAYHLNSEKNYVRDIEDIRVTLRDANNQVVAEEKLVTNEFGSASSSFVLPTNCLSGLFQLQAQGTSTFIRVEEYKRPSFEVNMSRPSGTFSFGDTVSIKGNALYLMGAAVSDAKVNYKITRRSNPYFWWWGSGKPDAIVAEGEVMTDDKGEYSIPFVPQKDKDEKMDVCYRYEVDVNVTDPNGETHSESTNFSVGDISISIVCPTYDRCLMSELSEVVFSVVSLNYERIQKEVAYTVFREDEIVATNKVISDAKNGFTIQEDTRNWTSGRYKIEFSAVDDHGREEKRTFQTILYRADEKRPPVETSLWTENWTSCSLERGEKKHIRIGTSYKNAHLLMVQYDSKSEIERHWFDLNDEIISLDLMLGKDDFLETHFFLVHEGQMYTQSIRLTKKEESKELPMKLSVFRDKMQPGSEEKWTITLPADKTAEVMAAMYDASLDQIRSHGWSFHPYYRRYYRTYSWYVRKNFPVSFYFAEHPKISATNPSWSFDEWRSFFDRMGYREYMFSKAYCLEERVTADYGRPVVQNARMMKSASMKNSADDAEMEESEPSNPTNGEEESQQPKIRTNFAETAFFFPHLTADKDGNVQMTFTMPESLTRWKFMALAHTQDLFYSYLRENVVTQKNFMISPNLPRFLRHGDKCTLTAKIINLSDVPQNGIAKLQLLDPVSEEVLLEKSVSFSVDAQKNTVASWEVDIPRDVEAYLVRTSASCGEFSDAEQKMLPVLSDRIVLTQSLPLVIRGGKSKDCVFENLVSNDSKTLHSRFLKLEMATNPIWYAVQALPSIATVEHENAISYSAAYFASTMAQLIAKTNPKIFRVIEQWKQQSSDKQTLLSNLEKNQDVKNVLLNECPWVMDAKNETEMKQRLMTLFDVNDLRAKCDLWLKKMNDLQNEDGGYAWFKDMPSGQHTTLFVMDNFGRLKKAGVDIAAQQDRLRRAIGFLDQELKKDFENLKRYNKNYKKDAHVSVSEIYYFQVRSMFPEVTLNQECKEAYQFYYDLMKKQWLDFSLNGRAMAAIGLYRNGDKEVAKRIIASLREFSTTKEDEGMFWKNNVSGYLWEDAAISTHTRIMEAFELVDPHSEELDEMRIWLLNQKRTQNWDNMIANVDALNVLLLSGTDWISKDNMVTVQLGGETIEPEEKEVGTGYYTVVVPGKNVNSEMGKVHLQSAEGGNISWGALYWQFDEELDHVKANKTGLHIEKMVMLEQVSGDKNVLKTIDEKTQLKVGDKLVVRLTLRTDRDLDYVSLKDQRASCLEPVQQISGYRCGESTCYYQTAKDAAMYYFFSHLQKGTYVFEYPVWVTNQGDFSNGITTVQCLYAPEFLSNTGSVRIRVNR